ncbi:hypothetical protein REPUB_Repub19eG0134800 [Reevesia pubescens]
MLARFWWKHGNDNKGLHWFNWKKLCLPKSNGGLGFRSLHHFNLALLAKQGWRLLKNNDSLCFRVLQHKYFPHSSFMDAKVGNNHSLSWRSLCEAREVLNLGLRWRVGIGDKVRVLEDPWNPRPWKFKPILLLNPIPDNATVNGLICPIKRTWDDHLLKHFFTDDDVGEILKIPLLSLDSNDLSIWHWT